MTKSPKDMGASVRARLLRLARERGEEFQLVLTRYANERLLYRLARSEHGSHFVLKGAALFTLWTGEPHRATRDVDLLGFGDPSEDQIRSVFADVLAVEVDDDGVRFDASALAVGPIREEQEYGGVRVVLAAHVSGAKVRLQIDIGFGDARSLLKLCSSTSLRFSISRPRGYARIPARPLSRRSSKQW